MEQRIIIFDLDGTLCNVEHRLHFIQGDNKDWSGFYQECINDTVNKPVVEIYEIFSDKPPYQIWVFTGRGEEVRGLTIQWFKSQELWLPDRLIMRPEGDYRKDTELKSAWLSKYFEKPQEQILMVFEDRDQVVKMYREHGIACFQVAEGAF